MSTNYEALRVPGKLVRRSFWMPVVIGVAVAALGWFGYRITSSIMDHPDAAISRPVTSPSLADNPELAIARPNFGRVTSPSLADNPELAIARPNFGRVSLADNPELAKARLSLQAKQHLDAIMKAEGAELSADQVALSIDRVAREQGTRPKYGSDCGFVRAPAC
jgi:hypothetical protein